MDSKKEIRARMAAYAGLMAGDFIKEMLSKHYDCFKCDADNCEKCNKCDTLDEELEKGVKS